MALLAPSGNALAHPSESDRILLKTIASEYDTEPHKRPDAAPSAEAARGADTTIGLVPDDGADGAADRSFGPSEESAESAPEPPAAAVVDSPSSKVEAEKVAAAIADTPLQAAVRQMLRLHAPDRWQHVDLRTFQSDGHVMPCCGSGARSNCITLAALLPRASLFAAGHAEQRGTVGPTTLGTVIEHVVADGQRIQVGRSGRPVPIGCAVRIRAIGSSRASDGPGRCSEGKARRMHR